ncbi:MAG: hypothetical protein FWF10_02220 [Clostridiales bacterium]|nr:hypothetical protein [Clostridiales bacterium]
MVGDIEQTQGSAPQEPVELAPAADTAAEAEAAADAAEEIGAEESPNAEELAAPEIAAEEVASEDAADIVAPEMAEETAAGPAEDAPKPAEPPRPVEITRVLDEPPPTPLPRVPKTKNPARTLPPPHKKKQLSGFETAQILLTVFPITGLGFWYFYNMRGWNFSSLAVSFLMLALVCVLFALFVPKLLNLKNEALQPLFGMDAHTRRAGRKYRLPEILWVVGGLLLFRFVLMVAGYALHYIIGGYQGTFLEVTKLWSSPALGNDAYHYMAIARYGGYTTVANSTPDGAEYLRLVFLPFYSYVVRALAPIVKLFVRLFLGIGGDGIVPSGILVSNLSTIAGGAVFYRLILFDFDRKVARRAIFYYCLVPISFILSVTMSDGLFFMLSVSALYAARKRNFLLAGILGALSAYTRILGILILAPIFLEYMQTYWARPEKTLVASFPLRQTLNALALLLIPLGLGIYLFQNWQISGNAFQFLIYQESNWYQGFSPFFRTPAIQFSHMIGADARTIFGLSLPNLLAIFLSLILLISQHRKLRASYIAYGGLYIIIATSTRWLLSAPRYLFCCFPILIALALGTRKRWWVDVLISFIFGACYVVYFYIYLTMGPVY